MDLEARTSSVYAARQCSCDGYDDVDPSTAVSMAGLGKKGRRKDTSEVHTLDQPQSLIGQTYVPLFGTRGKLYNVTSMTEAP